MAAVIASPVLDSLATRSAFIFNTPVLDTTAVRVASGILSLPVLDTTAQPLIPQSGTVSLVAQPLTMYSGNYPNNITLTAQTPTLLIAGAQGVTGSVTLVEQTPTLLIRNFTAPYSLLFTQPATLQITGYQSPGGTVTLSAQPPTLAISGLVGASGGVTLSAQPPTVAITGLVQQFGYVSLRAETPTLAITGTNDRGVILRAQAPTLQITGYQGSSFGLVAEPPTLKITGVVGVTGSITLNNPQTPLPTLQITGVTGILGSVAMTLPAPTIAISGFVQITGIVQLSIQPPTILIQGVVPDGVAYAVFAMHTERQALTEYTNFKFNSFCMFNGKYYGANDTGLFEITGTSDNGTAIPSVMRGGVSDFGTPYLKTVHSAYVGYRSAGNLNLKIIQHDDATPYNYTLASTGTAGIYRRRVITGRGLRASYYQWELSNVAGADFDIDGLSIETAQLSRRVGGKDA